MRYFLVVLVVGLCAGAFGQDQAGDEPQGAEQVQQPQVVAPPVMPVQVPAQPEAAAPVEPPAPAPENPAPQDNATPPAPAPQAPIAAGPGNQPPHPHVQPVPLPRANMPPTTRMPSTSPVQAQRPMRPGMPGATGARPGAGTPPPPRTPALPKTADQAPSGPDLQGKTPDEDVTFDFHEAPLYDVIESISRLTGKNFDVDQNIGASTVTVITHDKIPPEMAYQVLESILASRGFSMVPTLDGHLIKIIPTPDATQAPAAAIKKGISTNTTNFDEYATHIVQVKYADPSEIATVLKILGSKNARVDTYAPTNTLIITDTGDGLRRMFSFLDEADVPGNETTMEIFSLEFTRAQTLAQQLEQVLLDASPNNRNQRPGQQPQRPQPQPQRPPVRPVVPGQATQQVIGSRDEVLRIVSDDRLNSLIVLATQGMMERVRDLVKRLDTPTPYESNNLHIYELLNADAEMVEKALQPLVGTAPRKASTGGTSGSSGTAAAASSSASSGGGGAGTPDIQPFEQKVQVTRYDQTNSLLIVSSPQDYKLLESFISRLDVPQRQVHVDAVVMDVTVNNDFSLDVEAADVTARSAFGLTSTGQLATLAAGLQTTATATNAIVGGARTALATGLLGLGTDGGLSAGIYHDFDVTVGNQKVKIPFVPLLFQAIEKLTNVEVLSQPSLATVDNEEASIVVGQEVPFITSTSRPATTATGQVDTGFINSGGYTRVEREEVGVKLKVKPQISEGDYVMLELEIEISDTDAQQVGTVDILGPTTNKSLIKNKVVVKDGSTAVIAGLIRDSSTRKKNQAPIIGDIPVLGNLFSKKSSGGVKRNMVVLVTPHIVKEGVDLERVTKYKVEEYHDANIDALFDGGFFKKIRKKKELRNNHRPTFEKSEQLTGRRDEDTYGRGDIER